MTTALTSEQVRTEALRRGFVACGIASLEANEHADLLDQWLAAGYAGTMRYLHRQAAKRKVPALATPGATRAIVVLENYAAPPEERPAPDDAFRIAAYARGEDYHLATQRRLDEFGTWLCHHGAAIAHARIDAGPVPERELAARAGLGWIGKNAMLIHPRLGSWTFIGTIFTDLPLSVDTPLRTDHCGSCTRCLDACPTQAFVEPHVLDATRCLSYLTIEYKGEWSADLTEATEGWIFGCDICNDVCPWNRKFAVPTSRPEFARRPHPDRRDPEAFADLTDATFVARYGDTPLTRPGLDRLRRNMRHAVGTPTGVETDA